MLSATSGGTSPAAAADTLAISQAPVMYFAILTMKGSPRTARFAKALIASFAKAIHTMPAAFCLYKG
jgi:hypothetical protein